MWVLDYRDDVESDLSALHRVDDMAAMPARRFFALVNRLGAYPGAVQLALSPAVAALPTQSGDSLEYTPDAPTVLVPDDGDTPPEVIAQMRAGLLSELHGGQPMDWVDHDTLVREAQK
jgi:hypothetical protein